MYDFSPFVLKNIFLHLDKEKTGLINYLSFVESLKDVLSILRKNHISDLYQRFLKNEKNKLSIDQILSVFSPENDP